MLGPGGGHTGECWNIRRQSDRREGPGILPRQCRNCGPTTVAQIGKLIGGWPPTPRKSAQEAIAAALLLSLPADQHDEALDMAGDAISALYRCGFVIVLNAREERRL